MHDKECRKCGKHIELAHLNGLIFVRGAESIGPGLYQLQHLLTHILMWCLLQEAAEHLTVFFGEDLLMHWGAAVLDNALEHKQWIACGVRIRWVHFLFDGKKGIFRSGGKEKLVLMEGKEGNPIRERLTWHLSGLFHRKLVESMANLVPNASGLLRSLQKVNKLVFVANFNYVCSSFPLFVILFFRWVTFVLHLSFELIVIPLHLLYLPRFLSKLERNIFTCFMTFLCSKLAVNLCFQSVFISIYYFRSPAALPSATSCNFALLTKFLQLCS